MSTDHINTFNDNTSLSLNCIMNHNIYLSLPNDVHTLIRRMVFSDVMRELNNRHIHVEKNVFKTTFFIYCLTALQQLPRSITGAWVDNDSIFHNDRTTPIYVALDHLQSQDKMSISRRSCEIWNRVFATGSFRSIELFSYSWLGSHKQVWGRAEVGPDRTCCLEPFEDGIPLMLLGTSLYLKFDRDISDESLVTVQTEYTVLHGAHSQHIYRCALERPVRLRHSDGNIAFINGVEHYGHSPNQICWE